MMVVLAISTVSMFALDAVEDKSWSFSGWYTISFICFFAAVVVLFLQKNAHVPFDDEEMDVFKFNRRPYKWLSQKAGRLDVYCRMMGVVFATLTVCGTGAYLVAAVRVLSEIN